MKKASFYLLLAILLLSMVRLTDFLLYHVFYVKFDEVKSLTLPANAIFTKEMDDFSFLIKTKKSL